MDKQDKRDTTNFIKHIEYMMDGKKSNSVRVYLPQFIHLNNEQMAEVEKRFNVEAVNLGDTVFTLKCGYSGCKNKATYRLKQTVGKKQTLYCCNDCVPEWVKQGKQSKFYTVEKL